MDHGEAPHFCFSGIIATAMDFIRFMTIGGIAQLVMVDCLTEKPSMCGNRFFSQSTSSANSLTVSVQSHASTSTHMLKIPNTGSHTTALTHENTAHTGRNG